MTLDIIGIILVSSHIVTVAVILLWFGLDKPKSMAQFRIRFKKRVLGIKAQP
jgi:hypothetical protein